jgi:hypothetical protein
MWKGLSEKLKEKIPKETFNLWLIPVKEETFENDTLTLIVPNIYFQNKIISEFEETLKEIAKETLSKNINICYKIRYDKTMYVKPVKTIKHTNTHQEQCRDITTFDNRPNFKSQKEMELYLRSPEKTTIENLPSAQLKPMPGKYGTKAVASFTSFDSRYFTYPSDKRKSAKVSIKIKYTNGINKEYDLYRGIEAFGMPAIGQLNTTHAKILLAIIYIWQKQGSMFGGTKDFAVVDISLRELAHELGYNKIGGQTFKWLYLRVKELTSFPNMFHFEGQSGNGFTFLTSINTWSDKENHDKLMLRLIFHPFVSRQFYERKAFLRNTDCYKIKNPTAFKFLVCYDKKIFMGNKIKLSIRKAAEDLQLENKKLSNLVSVIKTALKELNGYKLNDKYILKVELIKAEKQCFIIAERLVKTKAKEVLQSILQSTIPPVSRGHNL